MEDFKHINTWLFDLDNTLYNAEQHVFVKMSERMAGFITERLNISREESDLLRKYYWKKYGTTLRGLMEEHHIDAHEFLHHSHDFDISPVPQCPVTQEQLAHLTGQKIIFTSAPRHFAERMVKHLGIEQHFDALFTIEDALFLPKPHLDTYHVILQKYNLDPTRACMFEDMAENLKPAADLGMTTVWCHGAHQDAAEQHDHVHHKTESLAAWLQARIKTTAP